MILSSSGLSNVVVLADSAFSGHVRTVNVLAFDGPSVLTDANLDSCAFLVCCAAVDGLDGSTRDFFSHICISDGCVS